MIEEIKGLTPKQVARYVTPEELRVALQFYYPARRKWRGIEVLHKRILNAPKKRVKKNDRLEIYSYNAKWGKKVDDLDSSYGIHIKEVGAVDEYGSPKTWSMSFQPWDRLINTSFFEDNFRHYRLVDLLAHFAYEITWYGSEKESMEKGKEILSSVRKIVKEHKANEKSNNKNSSRGRRKA